MHRFGKDDNAMKLCFSTIGCPDWSWEEIFATAKDLGMQGIEIRGIRDEIYAPKNTPFLPERRAQTLETLARVNLSIPCLTSGANLSADADAAIAEARAYTELAQAIGTPYIRVMIEDTPQPVKDVDLGRATEIYQTILDDAKGRDVYPLIETNGVLADSEAMARFLKDVNRSNAFVLWDIHHPFRFFHETPEKTIHALDGLIRHTHVKDSVMEDGKVVYRMIGYGDVPIYDAMCELVRHGYDGFVSLEWTKRWMPNLEEPGIVFAHFLHYMKYMEEQMARG